jgi:hypothetical protein
MKSRAGLLVEECVLATEGVHSRPQYMTYIGISAHQMPLGLSFDPLPLVIWQSLQDYRRR